MSQSTVYPATEYVPGILAPCGIKDIRLKMVIPSEVMQKVNEEETCYYRELIFVKFFNTFYVPGRYNGDILFLPCLFVDLFVCWTSLTLVISFEPFQIEPSY